MISCRLEASIAEWWLGTWNYAGADSRGELKLKAKTRDFYIARLTAMKPDQPRFTIIGSGS